jgi:two-component system LytT family response regulator
MKALIIEDEPLARKELLMLLEAHPEIVVVGEAVSPKEALRLTGELQPDLLFLDVHLRGGTGFDLLESLEGKKPLVIFTTAHADFAVRAFEFEAEDYLVKPIRPDRLEHALRKIFSREKEALEPLPAERFDRNARIYLKHLDASRYVPIAEICLIESEGNHSRIHFGKESSLVHRALSTIEERLPRELFFKANRAQIVNLEAIQSLEPWFSNTLRTTLRNGVIVEFSRRASLVFRESQSL